MCVTFPDRLSWILLLEHITRKCLFPCCGLCLHHSSFIISNHHLNPNIFIFVCTGRWCCCGMRKASESLSWPPTSSELTGTRRHKGDSDSHLLKINAVVMELSLNLLLLNKDVDESFVSTFTRRQQCKFRWVSNLLQEGPSGVSGLVPCARAWRVDPANKRARPVRDQVKMRF